MERDIHGYDYSTAVAIFNLQSGVLTVELLQSCSSVRQADTLVISTVAGR